MDKKETLELIFNEVGHYLIEQGFKANKAKDIYTRKNKGLIDKFDIRISGGSNNTMRHHVTLSFTHSPISKLFKTIDTEVRKRSGRPQFNELRATCSMTDWKDLFSSHNLPNGELWFTAFHNINDIQNWKTDYKTMMELSLKWFSKYHDFEAIKKHCLKSGLSIATYEMYLTTIKYTEPDNLDKLYNELEIQKDTVVGWDDREFELFYQIAKEIEL